MKNQYYVMRGNGHTEWSELGSLGPFPSKEAAQKAIKDDIKWDVETYEDGFRPGEDEDFCHEYYIFEVVERLQPVLDFKVRIKLDLAKE